MCLFSLFGYLVPYYIDTFVARRLSRGSSAGIHTVGSLIVITAAVTSFAFDYATNGTFYKNILYVVGVLIVCASSDSLNKVVLPSGKTSPYSRNNLSNRRHRLIGRPSNYYVPGMVFIEMLFGNTRSIVGNSVSYFGTTFSTDRIGVDNGKSSSLGFFDHMTGSRELIRVFAFVCLNVIFMFVELLVGWYSNSLGLISDAGHMLFDNGALFIGLYASYMSRWPADSANSFGYGRYEVLCAFVNGVFLVFIAFTILFESFDRVGQPPRFMENTYFGPCGWLYSDAIGIVLFHDFSFDFCGPAKKNDEKGPMRLIMVTGIHMEYSVNVHVAIHGGS